MYDFTVVVLEGCYAASVSITLDMLAAASKLAGRAEASPLRWRVCSARGGAVSLSSRMTIATVKLPASSPADGSLWVVPGLGVDEPAALEQRLQAADAALVASAVARHVQAGHRVAASCTAVLLLHRAGVLKNRRVTTAWWLAPYLQQRAPDCVVDADRMVCVDGPVLTGGAAFAQADLMLHALRDHGGSTLSNWVSRVLLIDGRAAQAPFIVPGILANGNRLMGQLVDHIELTFPNTVSVQELAHTFCMSARTLSRHVHRATGKSTVALIRSVKLQKARSLLDSSRMNIEQIAEAVGYQDSTALRRMMKKVTGSNPSQYRPIVSMS